MTRQDKITLHFVKDGQHLPSLIRTEMVTAEGGRAIAVAEGADGAGDFDWNIKKGKLRLVILAVVRASRLIRQEGDRGPQETLLFRAERSSSESRRCTETRLYDLTRNPDCDWLAAILSPSKDWQGDAKERFKRWFLFHHIRGSDSPEPPSVDLNVECLRPEDIRIALDGQFIGPVDVDWIESVLSAHILPEFPPYLIGTKHKTAGYMPSVGPAFGDRDEELRTLTAYYGEERYKMVEIVADSGFGKTALARWWMRQLFRDDKMREPVVFAWSFPRQSRSDGTRQSLAPFFRSLSIALEVQLGEGATPQNLANALLAGLRGRPTFLFLDGVETLLNQRGEFDVGGKQGVGNGEEGETTFHYDSLMYLLTGLVTGTVETRSFALLTSRIPVGELLDPTGDKWRRMELPRFISFAYQDEELEREARATESGEDHSHYGDELSRELESAKERPVLKSREGILDYPMAAFQKADASRKLRYLVRRNLEKFGISPERCLACVASCFDQDADWDAVMHVIRSKEGAGEITAPFRHLSDDDWDQAHENLLEMNLVQPSGGGFISFHSNVQQCVYEDFRKNMPEACSEVHRRLFAYFTKLPKRKEPDTIEEMQPLFRACWHGCNAGDFKMAFHEVAYPRVSRKWQAYVVLQLCEYEEALQMLNLFTEDGETFPASDLDDNTRVTIQQGLCVSLRFADQLDKAYRLERKAWKRSMELPDKPQLGPIASNLLRLQHIFGDVGSDATPVLYSLIKSVLPGVSVSAEKEDIPKSFIPQAIGYMAGIAALVQACRGNSTKARGILLAAWGACKLVGTSNQYLMPGLGSVHHALTLLELGDAKTVLSAFKAGEFDPPTPRYVQTGGISYVHGRALGILANDEAGKQEALALVEECALKAKGNFKWWRAAALLECGRIKNRLLRFEDAVADFSEALRLATAKNSHFKLIEVDALLGLAGCEATSGNWTSARARATKALTLIEKCGYKLRQPLAERYLKS
jgi:tetratricopeptide (TPR) repeat protein